MQTRTTVKDQRTFPLYDYETARFKIHWVSGHGLVGQIWRTAPYRWHSQTDGSPTQLGPFDSSRRALDALIDEAAPAWRRV